MKFAHEIHNQIFQYWQAQREGNAMPLKSQSRPEKIRNLLPEIIMIRRDGPTDMVYTLSGTAVNQRMGKNITGESPLAHRPPEIQEFYIKKFSDICDFPCGALFELETKVMSGKLLRVPALNIPWAEDDGSIKKIMTIPAITPLDKYEDNEGTLEIARKISTTTYIDLGFGKPNSQG
jgi:hypothetical protein